MKQSTIRPRRSRTMTLTENWRAKGRMLSMFALVSLMLMLIPAMVVAQTDYDTSVTFTALAGSDSYPNEGWEKLFDGKKTSEDGTKWCCSFYDTRYVIFEASNAGKPVGYTITTANDNSKNNGRNPLSWKLYGNNEGASGEWTLIQEVTNDTQLQDVDYTSYDYTITCDASYKYFQWEVTAIHSGSTLQVGEFELKLVTCSHTNDDGSSALTEISKTAATCTHLAYTTYKCSICNLIVEVEDGDLAPHTLTHYDAKAATCTETGNIEYWQCSVCNKTFSDNNAATEVTDVIVAAKGHSYNDIFVCTVCNYEDPRYKLMSTCDGLTIKKFVDNDYPWQVMDLNAEGVEEIGLTIPADSKGIMSTNYQKDDTESKFDINLEAEKNILFSFDYAVSSENTDYLRVYLDGTVYIKTSGKNQGNFEFLVPKGSHTLSFRYMKDGSYSYNADRAFIYNIKAMSEFTSYGVVDNGNKTVTLRKFTNEDSDVTNFKRLEDGSRLKDCVNSNTVTVKIDESFKDYELTTLSNFFASLSSLKTITGFEYLNTSKLTDMSYMFYKCNSLTTIKLGKTFDTSNVTSMRRLFYGCWSLYDLDIENLNTSNVTDMYNMFYNCSAFSSLDLSCFDTKNVTDMGRMFEACYSLKSIKFGENFSTSKVTSMRYMFYDCNNLEILDLTGFNTSNVTDMDAMFSIVKYTPSLKHIYVSDKFTTDNLYYSSKMFGGCTGLRNYDASSVDKTHANYGPDGYLEACYKIGDIYTPLTGDELKTTTLELKDGSDFMASAPFNAETVSYSRTIAAGTRWNTLCLPFEVSLTGQNFRAYKLLSSSDDIVVLEELETSIEAGTPVLIKMNDGETALNITAQDQNIVKEAQEGSSTDNGGLQLVGLYAKKMFSKDTDNNCYIIKSNKLMNPAMILENTSTQAVGSKGFRAYMKETTQPTAAPKMYQLSTDSQETALDMLVDSSDAPTVYYDLQGNRLREPQKGVNIIKRAGKTMKVVIK